MAQTAPRLSTQGEQSIPNRRSGPRRAAAGASANPERRQGDRRRTPGLTALLRVILGNPETPA
jgi:hypothetical protein